MKQTEDVKEIALDLQKWAMQMSDGGLTIFEALTIAVEIQRNALFKKQCPEKKPDLTDRTNIDLNINLICAKHISEQIDASIMNSLICEDDISTK